MMNSFNTSVLHGKKVHWERGYTCAPTSSTSLDCLYCCQKDFQFFTQYQKAIIFPCDTDVEPHRLVYLYATLLCFSRTTQKAVNAKGSDPSSAYPLIVQTGLQD